MIRPLGDVLVVRPDPVEEQTPSGIHLVGGPLERTGTVLRAGRGRFRVRDSKEEVLKEVYLGVEVEVGARVVWLSGVLAGKQHDQLEFWMREHGEDIVLIHENDVLYVLEPECT